MLYIGSDSQADNQLIIAQSMNQIADATQQKLA